MLGVYELSGRRPGTGGGPVGGPVLPELPAGRESEGREASGTEGLSGERLGPAFNAPAATAAPAAPAAPAMLSGREATGS